jgi:hypothetical protein
MRRTHRRCIDEFFQCYQHQNLPAQERWVIPYLTTLKTTFGRIQRRMEWSVDSGSAFLPPRGCCLPEKQFKKALQWLQKLTGLLYTARRAHYRVRHLKLASKEAKLRRAVAAASWRKRKISASQTLFAAWNIPYLKPTLPRRKAGPTTPQLPQLPKAVQTQSLLSPYSRWLQYAPDPPNHWHSHFLLLGIVRTNLARASAKNIGLANRNYVNCINFLKFV